MKKTGFKNIALGLVLAAAIAAPLVWEWVSPLWQSPDNIAPAPDSTFTELAPIPSYTPDAQVEKSVEIRQYPSALLDIPQNEKTELYVNPVLLYDEKPDKHDEFVPILADSLSEEATTMLDIPRASLSAEIQSPGILPPIPLVQTDVPEILEPTGGKLVRTSLRLINRSAGDFSGHLLLSSPKGIKSVSGDRVAVNLLQGDTLFLPVVFLMSSAVTAGENKVHFVLRDDYDREVGKDSSHIPVAEQVSLLLSLDQHLIMVTNMKDSVALSARVYNRGNTDQLVTVVMGLPQSRGGKLFYELREEVKAGQDRLFTLKVRPAEILWNENVVYVNISGLYGPDKQTFGNASLGIQSVGSSSRFTDNLRDSYMFYDNQFVSEDVTLSYRRFGKNNLYQLMGGGHIDLPVGNLALQGLIYKMDGQDELMAMNTNLTYRYNNSAFSIGNINEQLEYSTFGRGVKATFSNKNGKNTLKTGVVDNQFNLLSRYALFENGYSVFVKNHMGAPADPKNITLDYMYRDDRWENAKHHITGGEWKWEKGNNWRIQVRSHGALSNYLAKRGLVPSGSAEVQYGGSVNKHSVSGNFYYSSGYFPGNRRGTVNLVQSYNRQLENGAGLQANAFWSNFAPRSHHYDMDVESTNSRFEGIYSFPRKGKLGVGAGYQYQAESANRAYLANSELSVSRPESHAHRLVESFNWRQGKHYVYLGLENGIVKLFNKEGWKPQAKAMFFYNFGRFNLNTSYQYGGYFLSEQSFAAEHGKVARRLMANISWNQEFLQENLQVNTAVNYHQDLTMGTTWSGSVNTRYRMNRNYSIFLNSIVYNYAYSKNLTLSSYNNTISNIEAGLTIHLNQSPPATGKKSKLTLTVFHDKNSNNLRDPDETIAPDYMIFMGTQAFITDEKGQITYTALPFGTYLVKAGAQAGWFHAQTEFQVNGFKKKVEIPLKQAGSVRGSIRYSYNERTAKDFVPLLGGINLRILRSGQLVQRVMTDNDGNFMAFLPSGDYQIEMETAVLDANASVQNRIRAFRIEPGSISVVDPFIVEIRSKRVNIRQFTQL